MPKQTPEFIPLSEAVILTGKNDSTIRRFFKKPENKSHIQTKGKKVYVDKLKLLEQYPALGAPRQTPEQTPRQTPEQTPRQRPGDADPLVAFSDLLASKEETIEILKHQVNSAYKLLEQERQQAAQERANHNEQTINFQKLLNNKEQALQQALDKINLLPVARQQEPEQAQEQSQPQPEQEPKEEPRSWWRRLWS